MSCKEYMIVFRYPESERIRSTRLNETEKYGRMFDNLTRCKGLTSQNVEEGLRDVGRDGRNDKRDEALSRMLEDLILKSCVRDEVRSRNNRNEQLIDLMERAMTASPMLASTLASMLGSTVKSTFAPTMSSMKESTVKLSPTSHASTPTSASSLASTLASMLDSHVSPSSSHPSTASRSSASHSSHSPPSTAHSRHSSHPHIESLNGLPLHSSESDAEFIASCEQYIAQQFNYKNIIALRRKLRAHLENNIDINAFNDFKRLVQILDSCNRSDEARQFATHLILKYRNL